VPDGRAAGPVNITVTFSDPHCLKQALTSDCPPTPDPGPPWQADGSCANDRPGGLLHASVASNDRAWFVWT